MPLARSPNNAGRDAPACALCVWIVRLLVPIPKGKGFWAKTAWAGRRVIYWYVIILVMLAAFQRYLIYQPISVETIDPRSSGLEPDRIENLTVKTADGLELHGWLVRAASSVPPLGENFNRDGAPAGPAVIYFPGNAGHRGYRGIEIDLLSRLGADVYLFDYRGYGDNSGRPTEENLAADAKTIWNSITKTRGLDRSNVVLLGESLGGGVATRLAAELCAAGTPPGGLILRATFSSLADVGAHHYPWLPVRMFLIERFASVQQIAKVTCPILILHGSNDTIIPFQHGRRLFEAAPSTSVNGVPKTFAELPGAGHNDILYAAREEYRTALRDFFNRIGSPR